MAGPFDARKATTISRVVAAASYASIDATRRLRSSDNASLGIKNALLGIPTRAHAALGCSQTT